MHQILQLQGLASTASGDAVSTATFAFCTSAFSLSLCAALPREE